MSRRISYGLMYIISSIKIHKTKFWSLKACGSKRNNRTQDQCFDKQISATTEPNRPGRSPAPVGEKKQNGLRFHPFGLLCPIPILMDRRRNRFRSRSDRSRRNKPARYYFSFSLLRESFQIIEKKML